MCVFISFTYYIIEVLVGAENLTLGETRVSNDRQQKIKSSFNVSEEIKMLNILLLKTIYHTLHQYCS